MNGFSISDADEEIFQIGDLILSGQGDGQSLGPLDFIMVPRRVPAARSRMEIQRVNIVRNFLAQQMDAISEFERRRLADGRAVAPVAPIQRENAQAAQQHQPVIQRPQGSAVSRPTRRTQRSVSPATSTSSSSSLQLIRQAQTPHEPNFDEQ